jgi:AraC-like DNA-binding protein
MIRHVGSSASELIHERIELEAKRLLVHSVLTVSEIAYQLQFRDPSYFVRFFKRRTNITPGDYRARLALGAA